MLVEILFIIVAGMIILDRFLAFSTYDMIVLISLWVAVYFAIYWFYTEVAKKD